VAIGSQLEELMGLGIQLSTKINKRDADIRKSCFKLTLSTLAKSFFDRWLTKIVPRASHITLMVVRKRSLKLQYAIITSFDSKAIDLQ